MSERKKQHVLLQMKENTYLSTVRRQDETILLDVSNINQSLNSFQKYFCVLNVWNKTSTLLKKLLRILRTYQDVKKDKSVGTYWPVCVSDSNVQIARWTWLLCAPPRIQGGRDGGHCDQRTWKSLIKQSQKRNNCCQWYCVTSTTLKWQTRQSRKWSGTRVSALTHM